MPFLPLILHSLVAFPRLLFAVFGIDHMFYAGPMFLCVLPLKTKQGRYQVHQ